MSKRPSEADLLALIEGELKPDEAARVRRALEADPTLLAWVEGAMQDRAALARLSEKDARLEAPGLVEDAMAAAERRALFEDDAPIPIGRARSGWSPGGWKMAAAAAVLLVAGASIALLPVLRGGQVAPSLPGPVASEDAANGEGGEDALALSEPEPLEQETQIASARSGEREPVSPSEGALPSEMLQSPRAVVGDLDRRGAGVRPPGAAGEDVETRSASPLPDVFDLDRAVDLALEGRASVRVRFEEGTPPEAVLDDLPGAAWRPTFEGAPPDRLLRRAGEESLVLGELRLPRERAEAYAAMAALSERAASVELIELSEPIEPVIDADRTSGSSPWWLEPATEWRWRLRMPALVDPAPRE